MSALLVRMRRLLGEETANATLARNILAAVAGKLSGGGNGAPDIHRRCVLFDCTPSRVRTDDVCAALAPCGAIEAVVLCGYFVAAVVVFRTAAGAESALRGPARRSCHALPPLDEVGIPIPFIGPTDVKLNQIIPESPIPESSSALPQPPIPEEEEPAEPLPWIEFRDPSVEAYDGAALPQAPSDSIPESLVQGPTRGADGSLWMHGNIATIDKSGREIDEGRGSIQVKRTDPPPRDKRGPRIPDTATWFEPLLPCCGAANNT